RHSGGDKKNVEDPAVVRKRMHLLVADGAQRDDHHVKAVKPAPAFDEMKSHGAGRGEQEQGQGKDFYQAEAMQVQGRLPCCGINSRSALTFPWQSGPGWIARLAKIPPSKPKTGLPGTPAARIDDLVGSGSPGRTSPLRDNSSLYPATLPTVA